MFDTASIPYPDDSWDWAKLTEVATKLTLKGGDGKVTQWGFFTETSDMENYWSSLVWQNGGDILAPDHKSTVLGSDQAVGGIQHLQDLIWKDKIMPDAASWPTDSGDAFEQGKAAIEADGSWLVATHQAAGIDLGIAPLPKGPAGQATSINPTGAVVYAKTKNPEIVGTTATAALQSLASLFVSLSSSWRPWCLGGSIILFELSRIEPLSINH